MCDYQCTSVSFVKLSNRIEKSIRQRESNRIESNYFPPNRNALVFISCKLTVTSFEAIRPRFPKYGVEKPIEGTFNIIQRSFKIRR